MALRDELGVCGGIRRLATQGRQSAEKEKAMLRGLIGSSPIALRTLETGYSRSPRRTRRREKRKQKMYRKCARMGSKRQVSQFRTRRCKECGLVKMNRESLVQRRARTLQRLEKRLEQKSARMVPKRDIFEKSVIANCAS